MKVLYNIGIYAYGLALLTLSLFHKKAKRWIKGRRNYFKSLPKITSKNVYWFHCASLGEFDQALPVMNAFKEKNSSVFILVTFFSPSGFEHYNKREHQVDFACYLPLDTKRNASRFIKHFSPKKVFFVKYEFWANYIFEAKKNNAKLFSISSIFRKDQYYFRPKASFFPSILKQFDYFFVQNKESLELLNSIGIKKCIVSGDTRFDRVIENKKKLITNDIIKGFKNNKPTLVIGSSWFSDESILIPIINKQLFDFNFIIAPHDISENHIQQIIKKINVPFIRYTNISKSLQNQNANVLILDSIGQLANAYQYGDIAYIGGGFSGKLHNILEPSVFGLPVIFGPKHNRFPEASFFLEKKIAKSIHDEKELINAIKEFGTSFPVLKKEIINLVDKQKGAASKIEKFVTSESF